MSLHEFIWEATQEVGEGISPFYSPEFWMPHISLAYEDVDHTNVAEVIGDLAFEQFNWEMMIDNIALIFEPTGDIGALKYQFKFG
jgi:2'-5' RNA ligase